MGFKVKDIKNTLKTSIDSQKGGGVLRAEILEDFYFLSLFDLNECDSE